LPIKNETKRLHPADVEETKPLHPVDLEETKPLHPADLMDLERGGKVRRGSIVIFGPDEARLVYFSSPRTDISVGRGTGAEVRVDDPSLSREHARFSWRNEKEGLTVTDLGSKNGTLVNGTSIGKRKRVELRSGDEVMMGSVRAVAAVMGEVSRLKPPVRHTLEGVAGTEGLVVLNRAMRAVYRQVARVAGQDVPVLILGETGTGKEHVAAALHAASGRRSEKRFVTVNCGGIPANLVESTLFGHEKGAFSGAVARRAGVFEQASGGVLFLDEVGELPLDAQASLLRAVETGRITRVGSERSIEVDVRMVAATNCDVEQMVEEKTFRRDLIYRLNTVTLELPPLRDRRDEIKPLAELFVGRLCDSAKLPPKSIHSGAMKVLREHDWPGNVRQLKNTVERSVLLSPGNIITASVLPSALTEVKGLDRVRPRPRNHESELSFQETLEQWEKEMLAEALLLTRGNQTAAAKYLRMPRRTLVRKLNTYGLAGGYDEDSIQ
jgi:two-component system response regulator AtoC